MAAKVTITNQTPMAREVMTLAANNRDFLKNLPATFRKAAQAIDEGNGGVANMQAVFGLGSTAEAQTLFDRLNSLNAWRNGTLTLTGAEVLSKLEELSDALFVTT